MNTPKSFGRKIFNSKKPNNKNEEKQGGKFRMLWNKLGLELLFQTSLTEEDGLFETFSFSILSMRLFSTTYLPNTFVGCIASCHCSSFVGVQIELYAWYPIVNVLTSEDFSTTTDKYCMTWYLQFVRFYRSFFKCMLLTVKSMWKKKMQYFE